MAERHDQGFLARWSRRKQAAREAEREPKSQQRAAQGATSATETDAAQRPAAADPTPALPDPATLDASSDFSVFLGRDVPVETQRAALRRLWRLDASYNRIDGLDDYCADFTDQATVVKGLRTAYKVGRGLLGQAGEAAAHPRKAPAMQGPEKEAQRVSAASDAPTPPESSGPGTPAATESTPPPPEPHGPDPRRPRPLPRRR